MAMLNKENSRHGKRDGPCSLPVVQDLRVSVWKRRESTAQPSNGEIIARLSIALRRLVM